MHSSSDFFPDAFQKIDGDEYNINADAAGEDHGRPGKAYGKLIVDAYQQFDGNTECRQTAQRPGDPGEEAT